MGGGVSVGVLGFWGYQGLGVSLGGCQFLGGFGGVSAGCCPCPGPPDPPGCPPRAWPGHGRGCAVWGWPCSASWSAPAWPRSCSPASCPSMGHGPCAGETLKSPPKYPVITPKSAQTLLGPPGTPNPQHLPGHAPVVPLVWDSGPAQVRPQIPPEDLKPLQGTLTPPEGHLEFPGDP